MTARPKPSPAGPTIILVGPDEELAYLMYRYAMESPDGITVQHAGSDIERTRASEAAVIWFESVTKLDEARPRERGIVGEDTPIIVSGSAADDRLATELGADHCARHPLTYSSFRAALRSVGVVRDSAGNGGETRG